MVQGPSAPHQSEKQLLLFEREARGPLVEDEGVRTFREKLRGVLGYVHGLTQEKNRSAEHRAYPVRFDIIENQHKRVEMLIKHLIDIGIFTDRKSAIASVKKPGERTETYTELEWRLLSHLGSYRQTIEDLLNRKPQGLRSYIEEHIPNEEPKVSKRKLSKIPR